jgi:uncharacterized membrane protein YfcA
MEIAGTSALFWPGIVVLGLGVGYLAGMFGVGGAFILTPLLNAFGVPLEVAAGTSLAQMVGTSLVSFLRYQSLEQGEPRFDFLMLGGSVIGVDAGTRTVSVLASAESVTIAGYHVPLIDLVLDPLYIAFLVTAAVTFWSRGQEREPRPGPFARVSVLPVELPRVGFSVSALLIPYLGFGLGFLSGLLGVGGGVALMPVLVFGFGFPLRQAAGTGILVLLATSVVGTFSHALSGHVHLGMAMLLLCGSSLSAQLGALAMRRVESWRLGRIFALVVAATIVAVGWNFVRQFR